MPPIIHPQTCKKCGLCRSICPMDVFHGHTGEVPTVRYPEECWHCNACVLDCPAKAIELRLPLNYMVLHVPAASLREGGDSSDS